MPRGTDAFLLTLTSPRTRDAYRRDLHLFGRFCAEMMVDPQSYLPVHLEAFAEARRAAGDSDATVARRVSTVNSYARWAGRPDAAVLVPRGESHHSPTLTLADLRRVLEGTAPVDDLLLTLVLVTSREPLDVVVGLPCASLHEADGQRWLQDGSVHMPLPGRMGELAVAAGQRHRSTYLFGSNRPPTRHTATRRVRRLGDAVGLDTRLTPRSLAASSVPLAIEAGVTPRMARRRRWSELDTADHPVWRIAEALSLCPALTAAAG